MFGYIKPFQPELKLNEYQAYKALYCGLCKQLSSAYGPFSRLTLSYDFVFLSMLALALSDDAPTFEKQGCFLNPLRKSPCCLPCPQQDYSAAIAMLLLYHKAQDSLQDSDSAARLAILPAWPLLKAAYNKASRLYPAPAQAMEQAMERQALLEKGRSGDIDLACEPTAQILAAVFAPLSEDEAQKRVLERLGYLLGRYVYLADALDDLEKDARTGAYNPLLLHGADMPERRAHATDALYLTIAEAGAAFELLEVKRFGSILQNILLLGLKNTVDLINNKKKESEPLA